MAIAVGLKPMILLLISFALIMGGVVLEPASTQARTLIPLAATRERLVVQLLPLLDRADQIALRQRLLTDEGLKHQPPASLPA